MFMLVSATQDCSICLRCQYRLSLRQRHRPSRRWPTGYPQHLQRFATGVGLQQEPSSALDVAPDDDIIGRVPIRYSSKVLPSNQHYRHEIGPPPTKDSIGFNVLGEPAEVLILHDKTRRFELESALARIRASGPDEDPNAEIISSSEMLQKMDAERGLIDLDEVCENIESIKALWMATRKSSGSTSAYSKLAIKLQQGFTRQQLGAYLDRARNDLGARADSFDLDADFSSTSYARSSWKPLGKIPPGAEKTRAPKLLEIVLENGNQDDLSKEAPSRIAPAEESAVEKDLSEDAASRKQVLQSPSSGGARKKALVSSILRECWNFRPRGHESPLGQLDIRLRAPDLQLLLNHKRDIMKLISKSYDSKVEAWPQAPIVRITSEYDNCVDVIKILRSTIKNIKVSTVNLNDDLVSGLGSNSARGKLDNAVLGQLEKYTNTLVKPLDKSFKTLRVSYLGPDDNDFLESRRLIYQILRSGCSHTAKLAWSKDDETSKASLAPVLVGNRMSLLSRNQEWSRWCSLHNNDQIEREEKVDEVSLPSLLKAPGKQAKQMHGKSAAKSFFAMPDETIFKDYKAYAPFWTPEIEYHDSVKFGQILFPTKLASSAADAIRKSKKDHKADRTVEPISNRDIGLGFLKQPREFVPLVPGLAYSLKNLDLLQERDDVVQIRLSPSPNYTSSPIPTNALPDLEIIVSYDKESEATWIKDVRLVNRLAKDFLQPQKIVDLRFIREQHVCARADDIDPCITAFVQNSALNPLGTDRLTTPPGLSLSIPALAVYPHKGFVPEEHDSLLVDYTSLGLELRSSVTMPCQERDSWPTLTYTSIEAGRVAGRRDELSLDRVHFTSKSPPTNDLVGPDPANVGSDTSHSLHNAPHTSTIFRKTAAVIDMVEATGSRALVSSSSLRMPPDQIPVRRKRRGYNQSSWNASKVEVDGSDGDSIAVRVREVVANLLMRPKGGGGVRRDDAAGSHAEGGPGLPSSS